MRASHTVDMKNAYKTLIRKPEWTRSLERQRQRWEDNTKMDLRCEMEETQLAQDRIQQWTLLNTVMKLHVL
jgi:hypothetical protein